MSAVKINMIVAAILATSVIALGAGFLSELLYQRDEVAEKVSPLAGGAAPKPEKVRSPDIAAAPISTLLAAADPVAGKAVAKKCTACHSLKKGGAKKIGPNLWNILNRPIASAEGFAFSKALRERSGALWSYENLNGFLAKPKDWARGTRMSFPGIKKIAQRADLIAFLRSLSDRPAALPN